MGLKKYSLDSMIKGWFVGNLKPTVYKTVMVEVGIKKYRKGDYEVWHLHKIATEITVIVTGRVKMNNKIYKSGDIILIEPGSGTDFFALTNSINVVVKIPGVLNDKYLKGD